MSASAPPLPTHKDSLRDDSAIARSWDRVVSDYKTFHDVRAHSGTTRDLPMFPDACQDGQETIRDAKPGATLSTAQHGGPDSLDGGGSADGSPDESNSKPGPAPAQASGAADQACLGPTPETQSIPPVPGILPPQAVLGGADDTMKKLLMSWYYAGYYTGLYEGEQKALQRQPKEVAKEQDDKDNADEA